MKYRLALALILIVVSGMVAALVGAQPAPDVTITPRVGISSVTRQDIFVRAGPGQQYLAIGRLVAGDSVTPVSRNPSADWVMIIYRKTFGWIRRDLAFWVENIDELPIITEDNLTPSPGALPTKPPTATVIFIPTDTPTGNWVLLQADAQSGYVRAGPGRTYLRLGQLYDGNQVEPVGRDADTIWIMIRFGEGFGWVRRDLVRWVDDLESLPVLSPDSLTPTFTFTPSNTPTATFTPTDTATATVTPSPTETPTDTPTVTPSSTDTLTASPTLTHTPSDTPTDTPTLTSTPSPTETATTVPSDTPAPTDTVIPSQTPTSVPTETPSPSETSTELPTETVAAVVVVPSDTPTTAPTEVPSDTAIPSATNTLTLTPSLTSTLTETVLPSGTPSATSLPPTDTQTSVPVTEAQVPPTNTLPATNTSLPASATSLPSTDTATPTQVTGASVAGDITATPSSITEVTAPQPGLPPEAILGGIILAIVLLYIALYWRGAAAVDRYAGGFVVEVCPVCGRGHLIVETRQERLLGIPRPRRTVRCDECRSVLRETSPRHWRYAIDPIENPDLYRRYNGQELDEQSLIELANQPLQDRNGPHPPASPPDFVDDDT